MATVKKGILTRAGEWWTHLRPFGKRDFWHRERKAAIRDAKGRVAEAPGINAVDDEVAACYCALSGETHRVTRNTCCEVCDVFDRRHEPYI